MAMEFKNELTSVIVQFLGEIGIAVMPGKVDDGSFLPGVQVANGELIVEESKLLYPGDLLHEAGHLAVAPAALRAKLSGTVEVPGAPPHVVELEAICWSYAVCLHLRIDPRVVFHDNGYRNHSAELLRNFEMGVFLGVQGLEAAGMTLSRQAAARKGSEPFPVMQKWLRD